MNFEHERALDAAEQERDRGPDAEPVGPYAPTRTPTTPPTSRSGASGGAILSGRAERAVWIEAGYREGWTARDQLDDPAYPDLVVDRVAALARDARAAAKAENPPLREWLADQFGVLPTHIWTEDRVVKPICGRIDALVDVVLRQENRILERMATLNPTVISQQAIDAAFERGRDLGIADGRASVQEAAKFECPIDHEYLEESLRKNEFVRGLNVGKAEREAELLEQGWTPPGTVHEFEVSTGPTDADLWETALQIAGSQRNRRELETETVRSDAVWFYRELKAGPPPDLAAEDEWEAKTFPAGRIDGE